MDCNENETKKCFKHFVILKARENETKKCFKHFVILKARSIVDNKNTFEINFLKYC